MRFYMLTTKIYTKKEIPFLETYEQLSKLVNLSFSFDDELGQRHTSKGFKHYVFSNLFPIEKGSLVYKEGSLYSFVLKTTDKALAQKMKQYLPKCETAYFKAITSELKSCKNDYIDEIRVLTPAVATIKDGKAWTNEMPLDLLCDAIHKNACSKYKAFYGKPIDDVENFIKCIQLLNHKTFTVPYKGGVLLGNSFILTVKSDKKSQMLANLVLAEGLLEKNTIGMGFTVPNK